MSSGSGRGIVVAVAFGLGVVVAHLLGGRSVGSAPVPPSFVDVVRRCDPSVVHVTTLAEGERAPASRDDAVGGGFVFGADGWIVTSRHVLQGAQRVFVSVDGRGPLAARVVGTDDETDVAVVKVETAGLRPLAIGDPRALAKGDWVLAAGSPFHLERSWSVGIVSGLGRSGLGVGLRRYEDFIQTDAAANVGNSGGPLVNERGEAVGMMSAILSRTGRSQGVGLALPIDVVMRTAERLRSGQAPRRATIGVIVREEGARSGMPAGLRVTRFSDASPAQAAGLRAGDLIVDVDGVSTARVADLQRAVWAKPVGATVRVVFLRGGRRYQLDVPTR